MMLTYKKAQAEDAAVIFDLCKQLIDTYEDKTKIDYDKVLNWVRRKIEQQIDEYTVVYADNQKAGYYHLFRNEDEQLELDDLYVLDGFRNRGIGTRIIQKCLSGADEPVLLYVFIKNARAVSLYQRLGFFVIKTVNHTRYIMIHP